MSLHPYPHQPSFNQWPLSYDESEPPLPSPPFLRSPPPPPLLPDDFFPPTYLHHYTNEFGKNCIMETMTIQTSYPTHGPFGEGVYLTSIPPWAPTEVLLSNNWNHHHGLSPDNILKDCKLEKLQYCFSVPFCSLCPWVLHKMWDKNDRDIWVYRLEIFLGNKDYVLKERW